MTPSSSGRPDEDEMVTIKVRRRVKETLLRMQGLLQYRDRKRYAISDVIEALLANAPELVVPLDEELKFSMIEEVSPSQEE